VDESITDLAVEVGVLEGVGIELVKALGVEFGFEVFEGQGEVEGLEVRGLIAFGEVTPKGSGHGDEGCCSGESGSDSDE
jgi:hypothetical protein